MDPKETKFLTIQKELEQDQIILDQPTTRDKTIQGRVTLEGKDLGIISISEQEVGYFKVEDTKHIYRKTNSWSIPKVIVDQVDHIIYQTPGRIYNISKQVIDNYAEIRKFKGIETKYYIPLRYWRITCRDEREQRLIGKLGVEWYDMLADEFNKEYMSRLGRWVGVRRKQSTVYPKPEDVFKAFRFTPYNEVKIVIIGQDPYHNGLADGLAFSSKRPLECPKSLEVILEEVERDVYGGLNLQRDYELSKWAEQGVFLLNRILTVDRGHPLSHSGIGWEEFTLTVISKLNNRKDKLIFLLWGNKAKELKAVINTTYHVVIEGYHPAYEARGNHRTFVGCSHFSRANAVLTGWGKEPIDW